MRSQQHPWHSATKRQIMAGWDKSDEIDGSNADHVKLLLEDLQTKYDQIIANLQADLVDNKMQQEEALNVGLMKLPKSIRQMSVRDFNQAHNCDILAVLKGKDGVKLTNKRDCTVAVAATPAPRSRKAADPASALRTKKRGEVL
jgi:hypothetical protein